MNRWYRLQTLAALGRISMARDSGEYPQRSCSIYEELLDAGKRPKLVKAPGRPGAPHTPGTTLNHRPGQNPAGPHR